MTAAIANLLRPQQATDLADEKTKLERSLNNPHIQDKGAVVRALKRINHQLETQTPKPYEGADLDRAVKREAQLRAEILRGMPSQEEMRKSPPGAVGKHQAWEKRVKAKMNEWKHLRLRLNAGTTDPDVANFERYRPSESTLNMHNPLISGKQFFMPTTSGPAVMFTEEQLAFLREAAPEVAERLASMTNAQRAEVRDLAETGLGFSAEAPTTPAAPAKRVMSAAQRQKLSDQMKARHAAKKAQPAEAA